MFGLECASVVGLVQIRHFILHIHPHTHTHTHTHTHADPEDVYAPLFNRIIKYLIIAAYGVFAFWLAHTAREVCACVYEVCVYSLL
jgi:hypothetical protein